MSYLDIELTGSSIRNGRLYFSSADKGFFPTDSFCPRNDSASLGTAVEFIAQGESYFTDIRINGTARLSPRSSFAAFIKSVRAVKGSKIRVTKVADRQYRLDYLG